MTRRALILGAFREPTAPTDPDSLNHFAIRWNTYLAGLQRGEIDLKAWEKAAKAWENLK